MNIFDKFSKEIKNLISDNKENLKIKKTNNFENVVVENPPTEFNFDLSTNISLILGRVNKIDPKVLASEIKILLQNEIKSFDKIEIAGPGFLNIKLSNKTLKIISNKILNKNQFYGSSESNNSYNVEFVSANPTGPMHVGHCRGAIYGDVLSNLLKFNGNKVVKEYYINDYGNQIINFTKSVFLRIREIKFQEKFITTKDLYPGDYIIDIAKKIIEDNIKINYNDFNESFDYLSKESLKHSMNLIKSDLSKLGIQHDIFVSEKKIVKNNLVDKAVDFLTNNKLIVEGYLEPPKGTNSKNWKKVKRLIFKSTLYGDDADRALQKNDGSWTYFANDVAYHSDKVSRNFDFLVNILGADHTGYIKRITAAVSALSKNKTKLDCRVCQLVKLFKNGKPYKMSKRSGDFISASDLLNEVDRDSVRFMMLNRSNDVELDFDFDKVLEKNKDNPVFYVQYCYARINSLFRTLKMNLNEPLKDNDKDFNLNKYETKILRKVFDWPKIIDASARKYEPHRIPFYLYDLATLFHSYWSKGNEKDEYKFIINGKPNNLNTLIIIKLLATVIENGMKILGVSLPKKM
jgi:arginyl-tRNA synthetase